MAKWVEFVDIGEYEEKFHRIIDLHLISNVVIDDKAITLYSANGLGPLAIIREGFACQAIEKYFLEEAVNIKTLGGKNGI